MKITDIKNMNLLYKALGTNYTEINSFVNNNYTDLYKEAYIPKRNGDKRKIYIPNEELLEIQKKLKKILENSFNPHKNAMGFIKGKSIVDNAAMHVDKKYLLNIDLENFFETISSKRVYAMFDKYFKLSNKDVCFFLTRICSHPNGFLPQGAPTSPTVSNIIAKMLDKQLTELIKSSKNTINYSRYADDITFSSNYPINQDFFKFTKNHYKIGNRLKSIINRNGFKINDSKTRYQRYNQHQEVTGIIVNKKLNVNRKYIRNIRAMLHSIKMDTDALDKPVDKFNKIYKDNIDLDGLFRVIRGKIAHVGMVKGESDNVYQKLSDNFNDVYKLVNEMLELSDKEKVTSVNLINTYSPYSTILVPDGTVYFSDREEMGYGYGSAFLLKNYGIVSNYHVFEYILKIHEETKGKYEVTKSKIDDFELGYKGDTEYPIKLLNMKNNRKPKIIHCKIVKYSEEKDLVLLEPKEIDFNKYGYNLSSEKIKTNDEVKLLGYPNFKHGDDVRTIDGKVIKTNSKDNKFEIDATIYRGNSGGAILNSEKEIIGVASEGRDNHENIGRNLNWLTSM